MLKRRLRRRGPGCGRAQAPVPAGTNRTRTSAWSSSCVSAGSPVPLTFDDSVSARSVKVADASLAKGCTIYAFVLPSTGTGSKWDHESVVVTCPAPEIDLEGFRRIDSAVVTTRNGNEKSKVVHRGPAWLWPKPDFSDL